MLAAVIAAGSSFPVYADTVTAVMGEAPGTEAATAETSGDSIVENNAGVTVVESGSAPETSAPETSAASTVVVGGNTPETSAGSTVVSGSTATSGSTSAVVTAGSGVITVGGSALPGPGSNLLPGGGTAAPSVQGVSQGVDGFAGTVQNPVVPVLEKYTYDEMCTDIGNLSSRYGSLMKTNVLGTTFDGRNLYEVVVGNPNAGKHVLIHAGIHAREYMTPLLVMKQMEYALAFYSTGSYEGRQLSDMFDQVALHFVPMVNPDGITLSQLGIGAIRSEELRQTINQCYASDVALGRTSSGFDRYLNYWKANGRGVDLNQNFPANWEQISTVPAPSYATYRGTSALSEPETQALANLVRSRSWAATVSYHSMGNIIYWDYQGNKVQPQSKALADLVSAKTGYRLAGSSGNGGFKDWVQINDSPIPSLTLEVGSVSCPMPVSEFTNVWNQNSEVWAVVMKYALEH